MEQIALILKAYRWLDQITPLQTDCGTLCDKACCLSTEDVATENFTQNSGMYLFPVRFPFNPLLLTYPCILSISLQHTVLTDPY